VLADLDDDGVVAVTVESADLDDVFLALTGRATDAPATQEIPA
jgi:ABC-2 type transport system ATP-binding protein